METHKIFLKDVWLNKSNGKHEDFQKKKAEERPKVNILKDWHKKIMPNYEKAEIWLDDSIEPIKWEDCRPERH